MFFKIFWIPKYMLDHKSSPSTDIKATTLNDSNRNVTKTQTDYSCKCNKMRHTGLIYIYVLYSHFWAVSCCGCPSYRTGRLLLVHSQTCTQSHYRCPEISYIKLRYKSLNNNPQTIYHRNTIQKYSITCLTRHILNAIIK